MAVLLVVTGHGQMGNTGNPTGWYLPEVAHPWKVFTEAGLKVTFASPKGGKTPLDPSSVEAFKADPICTKFMENKDVMGQLDTTTSLADVKPSDFKAVFFAGGHGTMWDFPDDVNVQKVAVAIYEQGGVVSSVCHGPAALVNVKLSDGSYLIQGKKLTGFTNAEETAVKLMEVMPFPMETKLRERGCDFVEAPLFTENVQVAGRLVTGQNPASATATAAAVVKAIKG
ncbi:uncharacterized protein [Branchiostoma lanceolatum]|uniref:uncharacterized protein n=1 Tax=Branchiostoma lanceolatum TaxID=7740 RepID=UPI003452388B